MSLTLSKIRHVIQPGAVRIHRVLAAVTRDVALIDIDLMSKYAACEMTSRQKGVTGVWLSAADATLDLDPEFERNAFTMVYFPSLPDWHLFSVSMSKYNCHVVMTRHGQDEWELDL